MRKLNFQKGQSLAEVLVVLSVAAVILTTLMVIIINSLKNAQFAQTQVQATKYAQEALDTLKMIRDRDQDGTVTFSYRDPSGVGYLEARKFSNLWDTHMNSSDNCNGLCYFILNGGPNLTAATAGGGEKKDKVLTRYITIKDDAANYQLEKTITIQVKWTDGTGGHESNLQTIFTNR